MSSALSWELFKPSSHLKAAGNAAVGLFMLMLPTSYRAASHNDLGSWIFLHLPSLKHQHKFDQSFLFLHFHLFLFFPLIVSYFGFNSRKKNLAKVPKLNNNGKVVIIMILALSFLPCVPKKIFLQ